jgi:hypothetical protein
MKKFDFSYEVFKSKVGAGLQRGATIMVRCKPYPHNLPFPAKSPAPDDFWFPCYLNLTVIEQQERSFLLPSFAALVLPS